MQSQIQTDVLYLSKSKEKVCINYSLPQHQIEGLRFLYKQYIKNKPGVILNDPPESGKHVQVVLFLSAIKHLLSKPILIVCDVMEEALYWEALFQAWSKDNDGTCPFDVLSRNDNRAIDNDKIYIVHLYKNCKKTEVRRKFTSNEWSVVVIDEFWADDYQSILSYNFNCKYKICMTTEDLKTNIHSFENIYRLIYTSPDADTVQLLNKFKKQSSPIELDIFMEDIVLRRDDIDLVSIKELPLYAEKLINFNLEIGAKAKAARLERRVEQRKETVQSQRPDVRKDSKDTTGKNIKRSKPTAMDSTPENITPVRKTYYNKKKKTLQNNANESDEMDIETFIRDNKPIGAEIFNNAEVNTNPIESIDVSEDSNHDQGSNSQSLHLEYDSTQTEGDVMVDRSISPIENTIIIKEVKSLCSKDKASEDFSKEIENTDTENIHNILNGESLHIDKVQDDANEIKVEELVQENNTIATKDLQMMNDENIPTGKAQDGGNETKDGTELEKNNLKEEIKAKTNLKSDIDDKLMEWEEKMLKKFKGTFLDRIL